MKAKTIRRILTKKFAQFTDTITDDTLRSLVRRDAIITGGCIVSMLLGEKVNDYDIYFRTKETALAVANHYLTQFKKDSSIEFENSGPVDYGKHEVEMFVEDRGDRIHINVKSAGIAAEGKEEGYKYFEGSSAAETEEYVERQIEKSAGKEEEDDYRPIFLSSNAIMLSGAVQLIVRFFGEPAEIHNTYDFVHCTSYFDAKEGTLHLNQPALEAILAKELVYVGSKYPLCSVIRTRKFIQRGWQIHAGQYLKMILQLSELDFTNKDVLAEQLIGVDSAYFTQVIVAVKDLDPEKMTSAYLAAIIDRIFE